VGRPLAPAGPARSHHGDVALHVAQAESDAAVVIDPEHDRFEWVTLEVAVRRCLPSVVAEGIRIADRAASLR
jgi:hypothetical protein